MVFGEKDTVRCLVLNPGIQAISFTGSCQAGLAVVELAACRSIPLQLELGGNNAALIMADCDIAEAARTLAVSAMSFSGQRCTAPRRFIVHRAARRSFEEAFIPAVRSLPAFIGAPSTRHYLECERLLLSQYSPDLKKGRWLLKTDLWDEAKNSQILFWVVEQGSEGYGIDISPAIASEARANLARIKKRPVRAGLIVSDVRNIATADNSFDYLYSMGTIEHFAEYRQAIRECHRVLRPGGLAIIGVPNKRDPFLRPLLVFLLHQLNLYYYGQEKSFSAKELKGMMEEAGFQVLATSSILFLPGWLRMLDLAIHVKWPAASFLMAPLIRPFSFLYRTSPFLRRNGYLLACVGKK